MTKQPGVRVIEFLTPFFPDADGKICLRSFKPKGAPKDFARAQNVNTSRHELAENKSQQKFLIGLNESSGIYFIVNSGGHSDEEITGYNAFFVENDNLTIAEQGAALDAAPIKPSIRVETSKSIHAYWLTEGECTESEWREMQARLISYFDGDRQNKNPSRCMRLPGFDHLTYNGEGAPLTRKRVEVTEFHPERRYTVADMLSAFPEPLPVEKPAKVNHALPEIFGSPSSELWNWEQLNGELKRRVMQAGRRNSGGKYEMRYPAHLGQGETSLFYSPETGAVACLAGCSHEQLLRAFNLPETPQGRVYGLGSRAEKGETMKADGGETEEETGAATTEEEPDVCMADVEPEEVEWLVKPYIPLGALTIVEGDPDEGKSFATLAIIAALTSGGGLPFGEIQEPGNVLLLSAEDHLRNTIRPRLDWLGADVGRVFAMKALLVFDEKGFKLLEERIEKRQPKMVLFDPLFAYVGSRTNINSDNKVREITNRLAELAHRHRCSIVALRHLSKAEQRNAKLAGASSTAWTAAARSVLLFGHESGDEQSRGFVHTKHNLSAKGASQGYRIERQTDDTARFHWTGECELTSDMILSSQRNNGAASELERAEDFLFDVLQGGPVLQKEVERRSKREGLSWSTMRRAKIRLKVVSEHGPPKGPWRWRLADNQSDSATDEHVGGEGTAVVAATVRSDAQPEAVSV